MATFSSKVRSETISHSDAEAWKQQKALLQSYQKAQKEAGNSVKLIPLPSDQELPQFIDEAFLSQRIQVDQARYRWQILYQKQVILQSLVSFSSELEADEDVLDLLSSDSTQLSLVEQDDKMILQHKDRTCASSVEAEGAQTGLLLEWLDAFKSSQQFIKGYDQAYRWQLVDQDAVIMEAPNLQADKKRLDKSWALYKAAGTVQANYQINALEKGRWSVSLASKQGRLLARSPKEGIEAPDKQSLLNRLTKLFQRKTNSRILEVKEVYGFEVRTNEGSLSLQANYRYDSPQSAWEVLQQLPVLAKSNKQFYRTGDSLSLEYSFFLQDQQGDILAIHPQTYEDPESNEAQIKIAKALLKGLTSPYQTLAEYRFLYELDPDLTLVGTQWFGSQQKARTEARKSIRMLIEPVFLRQSVDDLDKDACLELVAKELVVARSPKGPKNEDTLNGLQKWAAALDTVSLQIKVDSWPDQWQFYYFWSGMGQWEPLLSSANPFSSPEEAALAYGEFVKSLPAFTLQVDQTSESFILLEGNQPIAQSMVFADDSAKKEAISWVEQSRQHQAQILNLSTIEGPSEGEIPDGLEDYISKTFSTELGTYGYQVIRKEEPLAVLLTEHEQCTDVHCQSYWASVRE
ncbi:MAG: hypothetical protein AAFP02_07865, partial [Bacteroidota bacterium]